MTQIIDPNRWQPLSIFNPKLGTNVTQKFTTPQWINVTSFALTCGTEFLPPQADIYRYGSLGYVAQVCHLDLAYACLWKLPASAAPTLTLPVSFVA